ncbi:MAG: GerAB/ArcD/ProY family transporter [Bacilli bacterium]|nr:GerAB/ArcD/ProY family transporter [Bacilli bacterium]
MNKIHIAGLGAMLYFIVRSTFMILLLPLLLSYKQDGLLICVIGSLLGYFLFSIILSLFKRNQEPDIICYLDKKLPIGIDFVINAVLAIIFFALGWLILIRLVDFTHLQYLRELPLFTIAGLYIVVSIFLAMKDFETISKASLIFLLISLVLLIIKTVGLWGQIHVENLFPLFTHSLLDILKASLIYAFMTTIPLFLLLLVNKKQIEPQKDLQKKIKGTYLFTEAILFLHVFLILTVLGANLTLIYHYPEFHLLRNVKILGFIDKLESILSIQWIIDMMICISLCFIYTKTFLCHYFQKLFPKLYNKINKN